MGRRTTFQRCTACKFSACAFYVIQTIWTILFLVLVSTVLRGLTFEPTPLNHVNSDWEWLWASYSAFATLSALNMIVSVALVVVIVGHWWLTSKTIPEYEGLRPKRSFLARISYLATIVAYFLLCCAALVMLGMAFASAVNLSGKFGRPNASSYAGCDPIDPSACVYPFPSSHFLVSDPTTVTKFRVNFGPKTLPKTMDGGRISPTFWNEMDGFSTIAPLLFYLPNASNRSLVPFSNISSYKDESATTVILNVVTGARMPHWTELDSVDPNFPSFVIQPAEPLDHSSSYMVIVRNIKDDAGNLVTRSPMFDALMGSNPAAYPDSARYHKYQSELIPVVLAAGIDPATVQLAWDFVTVSEQMNHGRFEEMRKQASLFNTQVKIVKDVKSHCETPGTTIGRSLTAKMTVPDFLAKKDRRGGYLARDHGIRAIPKQIGMSYTYVQVQVPCSLLQIASPQRAVKVVQYGHGLFGDRDEVSDSWIGEWIDAKKMVFFASDWLGMSIFDKLKVVRIILSDMSNFATIPETILQGWSNKLIANRAMRSGVIPAALHNSGVSIIPPNSSDLDIPFYGISQGGVIGGGYVSSSPLIRRAALGVPGSPFALLLSRSNDFDAFHALFQLSLYNWRDIRLALSLMQQLWDQGESAGWLHYMNKNTPAGVPKTDVLIQDAHGDAQVTILGARIMARSFNATSIVPAVAPIYGLFNGSYIVNGSAITEWKYRDVPPMPETNIPPPEQYDTHECIRTEPEAQEQIFNFFTSGNITQTCPPTTGCIKDQCAWIIEHQKRQAQSKALDISISAAITSPSSIPHLVRASMRSYSPELSSISDFLLNRKTRDDD